MKICAIICEYNPMHTGHLYQLSKAAKQFDHSICLMSGNFVQRAEPAIVEKTLRAKLALDCGASMVIELPTLYATANGERFANGAIRTLQNLTDIDSLVMGCETNDTDSLLTIAKIQSNESNEMKDNIARFLDTGLSYATALTKATIIEGESKNIRSSVTEKILASPNNLLCIEYVKAIIKNNLNIKPVFIKRIGSAYNDISVTGNYISASAIREMLKRGTGSSVIPYLAGNGYALCDEVKKHPISYPLFSSLAVYTLRQAGSTEIGKAFDCREGIENKLYENAIKYQTLDEVLSATKSKRYTLSRLKRITLQCMLGITKEIMTDIPYIPPRLLAIKEDFKPYLSQNGEKLIIRTTDTEKYLGEFYKKYFEIERRSATLYSQISSNADNLFVQQKIYSR